MACNHQQDNRLRVSGKVIVLYAFVGLVYLISLLFWREIKMGKEYLCGEWRHFFKIEMASFLESS
jgi:hypothetical protein